MNKRLIAFLIPFVIIWTFFIYKIGWNVFGIGLALVFSFLYFIIVAGTISGVGKAKGEMYLAKKYDEEKAKKKDL